MIERYLPSNGTEGEIFFDGRQGTHGEGCADWGPSHYECAIRERDELKHDIAEYIGITGAQAQEISTLTAERDELRRQLTEVGQDARRYRDWLRGGANIPPESIRWPRWEVRYWDGRYWNTLFAEQMDDAIDAAMGGGDAG